MPDRVILSLLLVGIMIMNKWAKFERDRTMDFDNIWGGTQTLTYHYSDTDARVTTIALPILRKAELKSQAYKEGQDGTGQA